MHIDISNEFKLIFGINIKKNIILVNSMTLYFFGPSILQILGKARFLALYFVSAVIGNLAHVYFSRLAENRYGYLLFQNKKKSILYFQYFNI